MNSSFNPPDSPSKASTIANSGTRSPSSSREAQYSGGRGRLSEGSVGSRVIVPDDMDVPVNDDIPITVPPTRADNIPGAPGPYVNPRRRSSGGGGGGGFISSSMSTAPSVTSQSTARNTHSSIFPPTDNIEAQDGHFRAPVSGKITGASSTSSPSNPEQQHHQHLSIPSTPPRASRPLRAQSSPTASTASSTSAALWTPERPRAVEVDLEPIINTPSRAASLEQALAAMEMASTASAATSPQRRLTAPKTSVPVGAGARRGSAAAAAASTSPVQRRADALKNKRILLLDLRTDDAFDQGHLRGAVSHPSALLSRAMNTWRPDVRDAANKEDTIIVLYCEDERTTATAGKVFVQRGIDNVFILSGGLHRMAEVCPTIIEGAIPAHSPSGKKAAAALRAASKAPSYASTRRNSGSSTLASALGSTKPSAYAAKSNASPAWK